MHVQFLLKFVVVLGMVPLLVNVLSSDISPLLQKHTSLLTRYLFMTPLIVASYFFYEIYYSKHRRRFPPLLNKCLDPKGTLPSDPDFTWRRTDSRGIQRPDSMRDDPHVVKEMLVKFQKKGPEGVSIDQIVTISKDLLVKDVPAELNSKPGFKTVVSSRVLYWKFEMGPTTGSCDLDDLSLEISQCMRRAREIDENCTLQFGSFALLKYKDGELKWWPLQDDWIPTISHISRSPWNLLDIVTGDDKKWTVRGFNLQDTTLKASTVHKKEIFTVLRPYKTPSREDVLLCNEPQLLRDSLPMFWKNLYIYASNSVEVEEGIVVPLQSLPKNVRGAYWMSVLQGLIHPRSMSKILYGLAICQLFVIPGCLAICKLIGDHIEAAWRNSNTSGKLARPTVAMITIFYVALWSVKRLVIWFTGLRPSPTRRKDGISKIYHLGLSKKSLGPWKKTVLSYSPLKSMQRESSTPRVSLPMLVKMYQEGVWQPCITVRKGLRADHRRFRGPKVVEARHGGKEVIAETSWVNFLEALGIHPSDRKLYKLWSESELVNGIVPMRWKGKDLVGICCVLGFQSYEEHPSYKAPMPLPMQWSGPLGYMQFRQSSEGCIAEFRSRVALPPQLSNEASSYFEQHSTGSRPFRFEARLWHSINGLYINDHRTLYIGGQNTKAAEMHEKRLKAMKSGAIKEGSGRTGNIDTGWVPRRVELLSKCPGLLSTILEGELANGWGLNFTSGCSQYDRVYSEYGDWCLLGKSTFPYRIGSLCMDKELLALVKEAVMELKPDGYYFTPTKDLYADVYEFYRHVDRQSDELNEELDDCGMHTDQLIFPKSDVKDWSERGDNEWVTLYHAMALCNDFQRFKKTVQVTLSIEDLRIVSKATECLREILQKGNDLSIDLRWAFIISPEFFSEMVKRYGRMTVDEVVNFTVESKGGIISIPSSSGSSAAPNETFEATLMADGTFSSMQVLAALVDVFLTYFWIDRRWISDVRFYNPTIPQSVRMC